MKLSVEQISSIRERVAKGETNRSIAADFNVSESLVSLIKSGLSGKRADYATKTKSRLLSKIEIAASGCWNYLGLLQPNGYGIFGHHGKSSLAHRAAYSIYKGEIPDGLQVCHTCDNRKCVNPDHLFLGTQTDNEQDKVSKGRGSKGEKRPLAKHTDEEISELKSRIRKGESVPKLAKEYGIPQPNVYKIKYGKLWRHVP